MGNNYAKEMILIMKTSKPSLESDHVSTKNTQNKLKLKNKDFERNLPRLDRFSMKERGGSNKTKGLQFWRD